VDVKERRQRVTDRQTGAVKQTAAGHTPLTQLLASDRVNWVDV